MNAQITIEFFWFFLLSICYCFLNSNQQQYVVTIKDYNSNLNISSIQDSIIPLTSHKGHKFNCILPSTNPIFFPSNTNITSNSSISEEENIDNIINKLSSKCFHSNLGWWYYEICPFRYIRQYHNETSNKISRTTIEFFLGKYDNITSGIGFPNQYFINGDGGRVSSLLFSCPPDKPNFRSVLVSEKEPLKYNITLHTTHACISQKLSYQITDSINKVLSHHCLYFHQGWWSYEYCHLKHIRQYHTTHEKGKEPIIDNEYFIGKMNLPLTREQVAEELVFVNQTLPEQNYVLMNYSDGTHCEIMDEKTFRKTTVKFFCQDHQKVEPSSIISISERPSCHYNLHIGLKALCNYPFFKETEENIQVIECYLTQPLPTGDETSFENLKKLVSPP